MVTGRVSTPSSSCGDFAPARNAPIRPDAVEHPGDRRHSAPSARTTICTAALVRRVAEPGSGDKTMEAHRHSTVGEGLLTGLLGGVLVALWYLIVDLGRGQIFYTPNVLGQVFVARDTMT